MKKMICILILFCCFLLGEGIVCAAPIMEKAIYSDITAYINDIPIPSYNVDNRTMIIAEDLVNYGFDVKYVEKERCLYIDYNENKEVTANDIQEQKKNIGDTAFDVYPTDIFIKVNGITTGYQYGASYNIGGKMLASIEELDRFKNSYIIWNEEQRKIYFYTVPHWRIVADIDYDYKKEKTENISDFKLQLTRNEQGKFDVTGENEQYLIHFKMDWFGNTKVRDFEKSWFENAKVTFDFCIDECDMTKTEKLTQLLNNILTINSEGNEVKQNIAAANEHIKVFINGEKITVSAVELEPDFERTIYHFELDEVIKNVEEIQTVTIECK